MWRPAGARAPTDPLTGPLRVGIAVEQLRRAVPGGIGTYALGLLQGIASLGAAGEAPADIALMASRHSTTGSPRVTAHGSAADHAAADHAAADQSDGRDPLERFGWPVNVSRLPGWMLTRAWDHGIGTVPQGYDVVHSVSMAAPPVRKATGRGGRGRPALVVTIHDLAWTRHPEATTRRGLRWHEAALRRTLRVADALVVPSGPVAADLVGAGADPRLITVVGEGCDHLPAPDVTAAAALLRDRGVHGPYWLTVGTLEPRKNLPRLFAAYSDVTRPSGRKPPLVVAGPTGWGGTRRRGAGAGRSQRAQVGATDGVVAVGAVPAEVLAGLYRGAELFVYVPLTEGYGLPPLEAMSSGVPVLASSGVPSVRPERGDDPIALVVDPFDEAAIARGLETLASDGALRVALAEAGRAEAGRRTWSRAAAEHLSLWSAVARGRR